MRKKRRYVLKWNHGAIAEAVSERYTKYNARRGYGNEAFFRQTSRRMVMDIRIDKEVVLDLPMSYAINFLHTPTGILGVCASEGLGGCFTFPAPRRLSPSTCKIQ